MFLDELQQIFREVFDNPMMDVTEETSANDVPDWTSIVHMQLLATIEEHYGISFSTRDIRKMKKVGDLAESIEKKLQNK